MSVNGGCLAFAFCSHPQYLQQSNLLTVNKRFTRHQVVVKDSLCIVATRLGANGMCSCDLYRVIPAI